MTTEITTIFCVAGVLFLSPFLSKILRTPTTSIEIIAGIILANTGMIAHHDIFEFMAHVGFFYLMFMAGTEVNLGIFGTVPMSVFKKSLLYLVLLYVFSTILVFLSDVNGVLIIIAPTISVGLILALYKEYGKDCDWLNLSMLVGTLGEVVSISLLTFASSALEFGFGEEFYKTSLYLVLLLGGMALVFKCSQVVFWWLPEFRLQLMPKFDNEEKDLRLSMCLLAVMVGICEWLHIEVAFGTFIAGIFIATFFSHKTELPHKIASFGFGFLVPIFFIHIGYTFDIRSLQSVEILLTSAKIIGVMIGIRVLSSFVFAKKIGVFGCLKLALSHSMPLTLVIAIASVAFGARAISSDMYSAFILAALLEVIIAMGLIKLITNRQKSKQKHTKVINTYM